MIVVLLYLYYGLWHEGWVDEHEHEMMIHSEEESGEGRKSGL
jgi:hypothetical protein